MTDRDRDAQTYESSLTGQAVLLIFAAMVVGVLAAVLILPNWLPNLAASLVGSQPKAFWYLSRATAFVAMALLWASMMLGVGITNKMARLWPGAPAAFALHEYVSLLGLAFALFHGLILLGDQYTKFSLAQLLTPFATGSYRPFWVGLGQLGFYVWAIVTASFQAYAGALLHGLASGTDSGLGWVQVFYLCTSSSFIFLFIYRVITSLAMRVEKLVGASSQRSS